MMVSSLIEMCRLQGTSTLSSGILQQLSKKGIIFHHMTEGRWLKKLICLKPHFTAGVIKANERVVF